MGFFSKPKIQTQPAVTEATQEKESAAKKARLLETQGGNKGAELSGNQGQSVRRIFG